MGVVIQSFGPVFSLLPNDTDTITTQALLDAIDGAKQALVDEQPSPEAAKGYLHDLWLLRGLVNGPAYADELVSLEIIDVIHSPHIDTSQGDGISSPKIIENSIQDEMESRDLMEGEDFIKFFGHAAGRVRTGALSSLQAQEFLLDQVRDHLGSMTRQEAIKLGEVLRNAPMLAGVHPHEHFKKLIDQQSGGTEPQNLTL